MFGFMRSRGCGRHYCGVCKTIGSEYGHAPRMLLNHDIVLVAEIMTALSPEKPADPVLARRNCLRLPKRGEAPAALRFAAATTVLLAEAKLRDHAADTRSAVWRGLGRLLRPRYRRAAEDLRSFGVEVDNIEQELATQAEIERRPVSLDQLAGPTASATAAICGAAAGVAGRSDAKAALSNFGAAFGRLVYVLDAWHDFERDAASGQFNALRALYGRAERSAVDEAAGEVERAIAALPMEAGRRENLRSRLQANFTFAIAPGEGKKKISDCLPDCAPDCCDGCCDSCCDCDCCCDCGSCDCG